MHVNKVQWLYCIFSMLKIRQTLKFQKITNSLSCSFGCPGSRISLNNTKKYLTNLTMPVKRGVASYLIQFISHTLNYHISYTLKPTFISHTKYKLRVEYRIHFLLFRRSMFISHTSVNFYAKFLQRSIFHANGPKRPIVSRA